MKSILDPSFKYVKACDTDLKKTFARVRREMREKREDKTVLKFKHCTFKNSEPK